MSRVLIKIVRKIWDSATRENSTTPTDRPELQFVRRKITTLPCTAVARFSPKFGKTCNHPHKLKGKPFDACAQPSSAALERNMVRKSRSHLNKSTFFPPFFWVFFKNKKSSLFIVCLLCLVPTYCNILFRFQPYFFFLSGHPNLAFWSRKKFTT